MKQRVLAALVMAPLAIAAILWLPTLAFAALVGAAMMVGAWEWLRLCGITARPVRAVVVALLAGVFAALWTLADKGATGLHHYTDAGAASWYDFAVAIQEEALAAGLLDAAVPVVPINTADFPTPAARPHYSVLDKTGTFTALGGPAPHWRHNLRTMISEIATHG